MPAGVFVDIADGFAVIDFVDKGRRGAGLNALLAVDGPGVVETLTRSGPRIVYRVPEDVARVAGLLDEQPLNETVAAITVAS